MKYGIFREANTLSVVNLSQCNIKKFQYEEGFMQSHWSEAQAQFLINERNDETLQKAWKAWLEFLYTSERLWSECEQYFVGQSKQVKEHLANGLTSLFSVEENSDSARPPPPLSDFLRKKTFFMAPLLGNTNHN